MELTFEEDDVGRHANKSTEEMLRTVLAVLRGEVTLAEAGRTIGDCPRFG